MNADSTTNQPQDSLVADGKWRFDEQVTEVFDDMLRRSIPQYEVMRQTVFDLGSRYVKPNTAILDLGCSRGESLEPFVTRFGALTRFYGIEVSQPMLEAARRRFQGYIDAKVVDIRDCDLRYHFPPIDSCVILSILTLQFTPIEYRQQIVRSVYQRLLPGGCFILVEKVIGATYEIDKLLNDRYLGLKSEHGYSDEQIQRKKLSLEGVLVPVTHKWNEELLHIAGFQQVDCFWKYCCFAGFIAIK